MSSRTGSFVLGMLAMLALLVVAGLIGVWTGAYQVAASEPHSAIGRWILDTTFENSVKRQAADIEPPQTFTAAMIADGAGEYKGMCEHCHGGVGVKPDEWTEGLRPNPPELHKAAAELSPAEVFWIVKHGVKMSGMPAFGATHDDDTVWKIAAFVKALPQMSAAQYAAYKAEHGEDHGGEAGESVEGG